MNCLTVAIVSLVMGSDAAPAKADADYQEWFKYFAGEWTYQWKAEEGEFSEKGSVRWRRAAKGKALVGRITTANNDQEVEIAGWCADKKAVVVLGFSSNGGSWQVPYTEVAADHLASKSAGGVLPDGRAWKSSLFLLKKKDNDHFEIRSEGTAEGERLITIGTFSRKEE